jgi:hypothetical protein
MPGLEYLRYWKEGGRWDLWVHDVSMVRDFIKRSSTSRSEPLALVTERA